MDDLIALKNRNARVEADKAWETSWTRRGIIALVTYAVIGGYLMYLGVMQAWLHAAVPAVAYLLSTLGLGYIKVVWIERVYRP